MVNSTSIRESHRDPVRRSTEEEEDWMYMCSNDVSEQLDYSKNGLPEQIE